MMPERPASELESLAVRRELLVATATVQRLRLARALQAPAARLRAVQRGAAVAASLFGALFAPQGTRRWIAYGRLLAALISALTGVPARDPRRD